MIYELHETFVRRLSDGATIPIAEGNKDYNEYLAWLAEGNTPLQPPEPVPVIPTAVSMRQARLALLGAGLLASVQGALSGIADPIEREAAQIDWEYATTVDRRSPTVSLLASQLDLDDAALDNLFTAASRL